MNGLWRMYWFVVEVRESEEWNDDCDWRGDMKDNGMMIDMW